jgi:hypothetical protein
VLQVIRRCHPSSQHEEVLALFVLDLPPGNQPSAVRNDKPALSVCSVDDVRREIVLRLCRHGRQRFFLAMVGRKRACAGEDAAAA